MRHWLRVGILALALLAPAGARAAEPKCELDATTCLEHFERMRRRPWLGVKFDTDSTGRMVVHEVVPGSPAQRAGVRAGDVLRAIEGQPPSQWFAGKAGWGPQERGGITVLRGHREKTLMVVYEAIPEELFARIVGLHMIEAHLAYMPHESAGPENH
jgi:membrane-associated protease RseP (regulator of RpoE activity)